MGSHDQSERLEFSNWILMSRQEDGEALNEWITKLFHELRTPVFRYVYALIQNASEAEDITQECFLRLFTELHGGKPIDHVKPWLFRVSHNLALDRQRQHGARLERIDDDAFDLADDRSASSEEALLQKERLKLMRAAMERLSTQQRACLLLRAENFRYRDIASLLGITKSTVFENVRRGLSHLTKECQ
jgi:RNA polymerase sigma-70 factor, ECF subfamily